MRAIYARHTAAIPEGVKVSVKSRVITVKGPRGILKRNMKHALYDMSVRGKKNKEFRCEVWFGRMKDESCIKTICSHVANMITGVTKGFRYRMRFAYAHFPINVSVSEDAKTVEIRNFLGEKLIRRVPIREGVKANRTDPAKQKDELVLEGNDIEQVSLCAADIHQSCLVKKKDIRKFLDGIYVSTKETVTE
eukprot:TRINITY_DN159_c0_g1_i1.p1 TRINITY_DN159_c0_g1~~TRINITY_DN159_c0_g1_i1.p1  ORF type:complete len:192 (-),score=14.87 TRINITY_DN159_c0_g1_i1:48-623(-)